jgi:hypothetical protein
MKRVLFLCHREGLSHTGTSRYIFDDISNYLNTLDVNPHCIVTRSKKNDASSFGKSISNITYRESFLEDRFSSNKVTPEVYEDIASTLLKDPNFILIFERNNPFTAAKGLFNQFPMLERLIFNITSFLVELAPSSIFSFAVPHNFINYCLMRVGEIMGVPVYFCDNGAFPWQYHLYSGVIERKKIANSYEVADYEYRSEYWFDIQNIDYEESVKAYENSGGLGVLHNKNKDYMARIKLMFSLINENRMSGYTLARNVKSIIKSQLLKFYSNRLKKIIDQKPAIDLENTKYVIFFMHYQPEATTMPNGSHYANQLFAIRELSLAVPMDWKVLVREHPFSFENGFSPRYRNANLYEAIEMMDRVQLMSLVSDPYVLIDNSEVVATITGTVGFQSVCRGRPVIAFGHAPFEGLYGVFTPRDNYDLRKYLQMINEEKLPLDSNKVIQSLLQLESEGFGYLLDGEDPYSPVCRERGLDSALHFCLNGII